MGGTSEERKTDKAGEGDSEDVRLAHLSVLCTMPRVPAFR
jgi:hypothetical protein